MKKTGGGIDAFANLLETFESTKKSNVALRDGIRDAIEVLKTAIEVLKTAIEYGRTGKKPGRKPGQKLDHSIAENQLNKAIAETKPITLDEAVELIRKGSMSIGRASELSGFSVDAINQRNTELPSTVEEWKPKTGFQKVTNDE